MLHSVLYSSLLPLLFSFHWHFSKSHPFFLYKVNEVQVNFQNTFMFSWKEVQNRSQPSPSTLQKRKHVYTESFSWQLSCFCNLIKLWQFPIIQLGRQGISICRWTGSCYTLIFIHNGFNYREAQPQTLPTKFLFSFLNVGTKYSLSGIWFFLWSCIDVRVGLWGRLSAEELMLLNCGVGEDSWESLGLQGNPTSPIWRRSALGFLWKEWC